MEVFHQIKSDALRTFLSLVGVSVGIFVVTVAFALVEAFSGAVVAGFDHFGSDMIMVEWFPVVSEEGTDWSRYAARPQPSLDDYQAVSHCQWKAFAAETQANVSYAGKALRDCKLIGVCGEWEHLVYSSVCAGRNFSRAELAGSDAKVILGAKLARELFGGGAVAACGQTLRLDGRNATVVGVLSEEGKNIINLYATDYAAVVPYETVRRYWGDAGLETMVAIGPGGEGRDVALAETRRAIRAERRIKAAQEDNFALNTMEDLCRETVALTSKISAIGIVVALFSLLIGGFGIVNIMLVSVKERTFSIGLKMALGAKRRRILLEFLLEALLLSLLGAALGLLLAWGAIALIPEGVLKASLSKEIVALAFAVATALGLASGIAPAAKASRLNPVEALRS